MVSNNVSQLMAKLAVLMLCLSFVIEIGLAFSSTSRVLSSVVSLSSTALNQQALSDDESGDSKAFFFTGEARSELENKELRRVFMGEESLQAQNEFEGIAPPETDDSSFMNIERERENLENLFRL